MAFGPPSLLNETVRHACSRVGAMTTVARTGDVITVTPNVEPGHGFALRIRVHNLECGVSLEPAQFGRDYAGELATVLVDYGTELLEAALESVGDGTASLDIDNSVPVVRLRLRPASRDGDLTDLERLEEMLTALLTVATEPYVIDEVAQERATARAVLGARPSVRRPIGIEGGPVFDYDPSARDRSTQEHRRTENSLIEALLGAGLSPFDGPAELPFDVGWVSLTGVPCLAEVKSTAASEREQLRLGLGQVLEYAYRAQAQTGVVWQPVLVASRHLQEKLHGEVAKQHGVELVAGEPFDRITEIATTKEE